jgi:hypothetical protein
MSGGESWTSAASSGTARDVKRSGISDKKIGIKSARPSAMAVRRAGPVKSESDRKRPWCSGLANGTSPDVCIWYSDTLSNFD